MRKRKGSLLGLLVLFVILILGVVIYLQNKVYKERMYINLYDSKTIDKRLEVPPFTERVTDSDRELIGECDLIIGTSIDQVSESFSEYANKCGFEFVGDKSQFTITTRRNYKVIATKVGNKLELRWTPDLTLQQKTKAKKLFGYFKPQEED